MAIYMVIYLLLPLSLTILPLPLLPLLILSLPLLPLLPLLLPSNKILLPRPIPLPFRLPPHGPCPRLFHLRRHFPFRVIPAQNRPPSHGLGLLRPPSRKRSSLPSHPSLPMDSLQHHRNEISNAKAWCPLPLGQRTFHLSLLLLQMDPKSLPFATQPGSSLQSPSRG